MSLINDALKRAKEAQQAAPVLPPAPPLRPTEPAPRLRRGVGLGLPVALGGTALLLLFLVWRASENRATEDRVRARANTAEAAATSPVAVVSESPASVPDSPAPVRSRPELVPAPGETGRSILPTARSNTTPDLGIPELSLASTNSADEAAPTNAVAPAVPPPPPKPKLQGIIYDPRRPSAVINGKSLFVGEHTGGFRVVAIRPNSVVLVGGGKTNVLALE